MSATPGGIIWTGNSRGDWSEVVSVTTPRYEILDHTADVKLRAYGGNLQEAFAAAAWGMFAQILDPAKVTSQERRAVVVTGQGYEELLVAWLNELLYLLDAEGLALGSFEIEELSPTELRAWVGGERLDRARHRVGGTTIKAATYHQVLVSDGSPCIVEVVVDV